MGGFEMIVEHEVDFNYLKMYILFEIFYLEVMNLDDKNIVKCATQIMDYLQKRVYGKEYNNYLDTKLLYFKSIYEIEKGAVE